MTVTAEPGNQAPSSQGPLCFVLMPFGKKPDSAGTMIDFDAVYRDLLQPAILGAGLQPLRADEELSGGIIHKPMFERLILCEYAVADLTLANANVFYELGVRHAARPWSTVSVYAGSSRLPFDVAQLRTVPYSMGADGLPTNIEATRRTFVQVLRAAQQQQATDSPLYQLLEGYPNITHEKTDVFRDQVRIATEHKQRLAEARRTGKNHGNDEGQKAVRAVEENLGTPSHHEAGVLVDLLLSYRAVAAWQDMIRLVESLPEHISHTVLVREQYALALNRIGNGERAQEVLEALVEAKGPSSETLGILGRVLKDRWDRAVAADDVSAPALLDEAIDAYRRGFEADFRDAYPGINAVTLMTIRDSEDPEIERLAAVVRYAAERRVAGGKPDYWDYATLLEAAVIARDEKTARRVLPKTVAAMRERWEAGTTARNLRLLREARARSGTDLPWAKELEDQLQKRAE